MATSVKGTTQHNSNSNGAVRHYKAKVETLSEKLPFLSEEAEEKLSEITTTVSKVSKRYLKVGRQYIKNNPVAVVMIATGVGFIVGNLFSLFLRKRN